MNALEQQLDYPLQNTQPEPGQVIDVAPGIRWVRMPLPFALDHVNLWLLRDRFEGREGWTVVDCGITRPETIAYWETIFANSLEGLPIVRVLVTHMHPDHIGLAHWLTERWDAPLWMSMTDYVLARLFASGSEGGGAAGGERAVAFFTRNGLNSPEAIAKIRARTTYYADMVPAVPSTFVRILHGETVRIGDFDWQAVVGYGHAPEHLSFYCAALNVFIAGDMVLPRISTNVSVFDYDPDADPLRLYLSSLDNYAFMPEDVLALPSHGRPFRGLHTRIQQQRDHHAARLDEVRNACAEPRSAADIVPMMFHRPLDAHQTTFAMGEALAHLNLLYHAGELTRALGDDGVMRFVVAPR